MTINRYTSVELGYSLQDCLRASGMTRQKVATLAKVHIQTVARALSGDPGMPLDTYARIAAAMEASIQARASSAALEAFQKTLEKS